jgi:hypothetical protein
VETNKALERMSKRRRLSGLIPVLAVVGILVGAYSMMVPARGGFDEWGYNYGARLFNGWLGYADKTVGSTDDAMLLMKWSSDWTPQADEPVGAWCTNHFTWYSNEYSEDTWYGWETRDKWVDSDGPFVWSMVGDWTIHVDYLGGAYMHYLVVADQSDAGLLAGSGSSPSGPVTYEMTGTVSGDHVSFTMALDYDGSSYVGTLVGTIADSGTIRGTWYSNAGQNGIWWSELGVCTKVYEGVAHYKITEFLKMQKVGDDPAAWAMYEQGGAYSAGWGSYSSGVPKYVVYQDVIDVRDSATKQIVAHYDLCTSSPKGLGHPIF